MGNHCQAFVFVPVVRFRTLSPTLLGHHGALALPCQPRQFLVQFDELALQLLLVGVDRLADSQAAVGIHREVGQEREGLAAAHRSN